ncbi:MAG: preprotein translocase subunit SecG [Deltaproteobacteria bacterium]|nr:preprotein translocase subunit SecG [Deltaproteobacteria bacterium]
MGRAASEPNVLYYLAIALYVICCLFLIVVVLLQPGQVARRGGGGVFGAGSSTGSVFGGRGASTVLSRATTIAAGAFMVLSIILARAGSDQSAAEGAVGDVLAQKKAETKPADAKPDDKAAKPAADSATPAAK